MSVEVSAFLAAQKGVQSMREIDVSVIGVSHIKIDQSVFTDHNGERAVCTSRKFKSIADIAEALQRPGANYYVYKLYELPKFGQDLQPTGEVNYILRYSARRVD